MRMLLYVILHITYSHTMHKNKVQSYIVAWEEVLLANRQMLVEGNR